MNSSVPLLHLKQSYDSVPPNINTSVTPLYIEHSTTTAPLKIGTTDLAPPRNYIFGFLRKTLGVTVSTKNYDL